MTDRASEEIALQNKELIKENELQLKKISEMEKTIREEAANYVKLEWQNKYQTVMMEICLKMLKLSEAPMEDGCQNLISLTNFLKKQAEKLEPFTKDFPR